MLRPFAHPVACCCVLLGVDAQSLKPVKQHCWPTMLGVVASVCTQLYKVTYLAKRSVKLDHIDILLLQKRDWINYIDYNYIN